jgi:hypothetical protein
METRMKPKSMNAWIAALAMGRGTHVAAANIGALKPITFGAKVCPPGGGKE